MKNAAFCGIERGIFQFSNRYAERPLRPFNGPGARFGDRLFCLHSLGFSCLNTGIVGGRQVQGGGKTEVECDSQHQSVAAAAPLISFGMVMHRENFFGSMKGVSLWKRIVSGN
jgi:hypothetical protein